MNDEGAFRTDLVVDASTLLAAYFPDECTPQAHRLMEEYSLGQVDLWAPRLLVLELLNACLTARKRSRISEDVMDDLAAQIAVLDLNWVDVEESAEQVFSLGKEHGLTAYDAAYVAAARIKGCRLITGDRKLHEAAKDKLPFVVLLENYQGACEN